MKLFSTFKVSFFEQGSYLKCRIFEFTREHGEGFNAPQIIFTNKGQALAYDEQTASKIIGYWNENSKGNTFFELMRLKNSRLFS